MKIFSRYTAINLVANIVIFVVACVAFYFSLKFVLIQQINEDLEIERDEIVAYAKKYQALPEQFPVSDQVINFLPTDRVAAPAFSTIRVLHAGGKPESFRKLSFTVTAGEKLVMAEVSKSLEETNNLLRSILLIAASTILLILVVSIYINRVVIRNLWRPFYTSLEAVKQFRISKDQPLTLPHTNIDEFLFLNSTLNEIANRSRVEYATLKTFSENASHEIQTPLAIIRSKLDLLIQDEQLTEKQGRAVQGVYDSIETLNRLNHSLLLLTKIENSQFEQKELIDMELLIEQKLQDFQELWQAQLIRVHISLSPSTISMNPHLADILLNNLLSNATHHNSRGGHIAIELNRTLLRISNSSHEPALDEEQLFARFYKPSRSGAGNGLGLSIIKQITEVSGIELSYDWLSGEHRFDLRWNTP